MSAPIEAPYFIRWISVVLTTLPGPSDAFAKIVDSLAWPVVVVMLVFRFRRYLRIVLDVIAKRVVTDHIKVGPVELNTVISADHAMSRLLVLNGEPQGNAAIAQWISTHVGTEVSILDFLTEPKYADLRKSAARGLSGNI